MAPSVAVKAVWAVGDGGGTVGGAFGFQPGTAPDSEAKMNAAGPLLVPSVTTKSVVPLNTWPVGAPPGMVTLNGWVIGLPLTSPRYNSLRSAPLDDTQNGLVALREMPQALTRVGSVTGATPAWSDTRSVAMYAVAAAGTARASRDSTPSRGRKWVRDVGLRRARETRTDIGDLRRSDRKV